MTISEAIRRGGDVYFMYPIEQVMFRYDAGAKKCFRRFFEEAAEAEVPDGNDLLNQAIRFGERIGKSEWDSAIAIAQQRAKVATLAMFKRLGVDPDKAMEVGR